MNDSEFRTALREQLGPTLDQLSAPDLLSGVRSRQAKHKRSVRAGLALASAATVAAVVTSAALWPHAESLSPSAPAPSVVPASAVSASAAPVSVVPSPSTAVVDMSEVAPLVTSGPCAGLAVAAYQESAGVHPPVTAVTSVGVVITMGGGQLLGLKASGPCVDRLSYVQRTPTFQDQINVPYAFPDGAGGIVTTNSPRNEIGVVQLFIDCKGLVCGGSGAPLATITVKINGTGPGAASLPFDAASLLPAPTGGVLIVPSVIGLSADAAVKALLAAGFRGYGEESAGKGALGVVLSEDPPAGSVVPESASVVLDVSGGLPRPSQPAAPSGPVIAPMTAGPSLPPPTTAPMPSVVGLMLAHAEKVLTKANIVYAVTYQSGPRPKGIVVSQTPVAGAIVRVQSKVELTVSLGPLPATTGTRG
jgi:hypothetical protein